MIPFDINKIEVPIEVEYSKLAFVIEEQCATQKIKIPNELSTFVLKYSNDGEGFEWEMSILKHVDEMSDDIIEKWLNTVTGHMCRAELRGVLKARKNKNAPTEQ